MPNMKRQGIVSLLISSDHSRPEVESILRDAMDEIGPLLLKKGVRLDRMLVEHMSVSPGHVGSVEPVRLPPLLGVV